MMTNNRWILFGLALSLLLISHRVLAHHGFANFQMDQRQRSRAASLTMN